MLDVTLRRFLCMMPGVELVPMRNVRMVRPPFSRNDLRGDGIEHREALLGFVRHDDLT